MLHQCCSIMQAARDSWRRLCQVYDCLTLAIVVHYQALCLVRGDHTIYSTGHSHLTCSFRSANCVIVGFPAAAVRLAASNLASFVFSAMSLLLQRNTGGPTTSSERKLFGQAPTRGICSQDHTESEACAGELKHVLNSRCCLKREV
jgi:hypothetical protein